MFTNNNFYGVLHGKSINDFKIDKTAYKIQRSDERVDYIYKKLNTNTDLGYECYHKYFEDLFTQTTDMPLDKDGIYRIEIDNEDRYVDYDEYITWCKDSDNDPLEYAEVTNPFNDICVDVDETGEWRYTGVNTSNVKLILNKSDSLYSESNIALALEKLGSYILNSPKHIVDGLEVPKRENIKYKIYDSKELFARACQEYNYINDFARSNGRQSMLSNEKMDGETFPIFQPHKQNFNKVKTVKFLGKNDFKQYPILECYNKLHMDLKEKLNDKNLDNNTRNKIAYLIKGVKEDLDDVKLAVMRPIIFKSPLTPHSDSHCKDIIIPLKKEILPLLQYKYDDINDTDMICCILDIKDIVSKCKFTDRQQKVLELWMKDFNLNDIEKELHMTHKQINSMLNSIVNKIMKKYEEQYEDWIGFNYKKSEWKKCSKCGESKLLKRFDKNGNKGLKSICKECR